MNLGTILKPKKSLWLITLNLCPRSEVAIGPQQTAWRFEVPTSILRKAAHSMTWRRKKDIPMELQSLLDYKSTKWQITLTDSASIGKGHYHYWPLDIITRDVPCNPLWMVTPQTTHFWLNLLFLSAYDWEERRERLPWLQRRGHRVRADLQVRPLLWRLRHLGEVSRPGLDRQDTLAQA